MYPMLIDSFGNTSMLCGMIFTIIGLKQKVLDRNMHGPNWAGLSKVSYKRQPLIIINTILDGINHLSNGLGMMGCKINMFEKVNSILSLFQNNFYKI